MKRMALIMAGFVLAFWGSGCATIVSGRHQDIHITSDPPGARVKADNGIEVTTPADVSLVRNKPHTLVAEYPGAEPQQRGLRSDFNAWVLGNILIGGIIGVVVDFASGASGQLSPGVVHFNFTGAGQAAEQRKQEYLDAHPDLKENRRLAILYERPGPGVRKEELAAAFGDADQVVQKGKYEKCIYEERKPRYWYVKNDVVQWTED